MSARRRTWEIVEVAREGDAPSRAFDIVILSLILLNVVAVVLESLPSLASQYERSFGLFESLSVAVFAVEYLARLWSCVEAPGFERGISGRVRFAIRPLSLVDLLSILPSFLVALGIDLRFLRAFRLFRLVRVAKLARYVSALRVIRGVFCSKREELVLTTATMFVLLIVSSSIMYFAENQAQPEGFSSIPASMWWAIATLTTVGYGDVYPITAVGKVAAAVVAILGIGLFALPTAIIGSGFVEAVQKGKRPSRCPHCGEPIE